MRISSTYFSTNFLNSTNKLQQQQVSLQNQVTTGLKVSQPEDDPAVMTQVLNLQTAADQNAQFQSNITNLQNSAVTASSAMTLLQTQLSQASVTAANAVNGTNAAQLPTYANQVQSQIQAIFNLANTQDAQGNYIFGGTASGTPPFVATRDANNNITGVTYQGNSSVSSSSVSPGVSVSANVPGSNTTGATPAGLFTNSQSGADIFNHLLALQADIKSGTPAALANITSSDIPALGKDSTNVTNQIGVNAALQATLTNAASAATTKATNLTAQISSLTSADLATTITQLQQTQTAYQAALESGTQIFQLSILNYIQ